MSRWRWMEGRTVQSLGGGWIARITCESKSAHEPQPHPLAVRIARHWEIEGYGITPEAAIADLRRRFEANNERRPATQSSAPAE